MTISEFRLKTKEALNTVDTKGEILITRGGKIYKVVRAN
jgi:hypothetical protein